MKNYLLFICLFGVLQLGVAQISGTVYQDLPVNGTTLNTYGVKDGNELGVEGVTVTAYPGGMTTTTAADGTYTIAGVPAGSTRVEFSSWPSYLQESTDGGGTNSSVQFTTAPGTNVDFGLHDPEDFSDDANPVLLLPSWANGLQSGNSRTAIYSFKYGYNGQNTDEFSNGMPETPPLVDATHSEVGTIWGIATQKSKNRYFGASAIRCHSELADGTGFIYVIDKSAPTGSLAHKFDLNGVITASGGTIDLGSVCRGGGCENDPGNTGDVTDYELGSESSPNYDIDAAKKVGKVSFGDIDMQPTTSILWAVNLKQKALITIDVSDDTATNLPGAIDQYLISSLPGIPSCTNGELRPWALDFSRGKGYLGVVCDASTGSSSDLKGYILSFDPNNIAAGFTTELTIPNLDFQRSSVPLEFRPWTSDWSDFDYLFGSRVAGPQPIISDIEFTAKGDMVIAVTDRGSMQVGAGNYTLDLTSSSLVDGEVSGDIFHACKTSSGFLMENGTTGCGYNFPSSNEGFDGLGEFYDDQSGDSNQESGAGSLAILQGSNVIAASVLDPHPSGVENSDSWNSQGINFFNDTNGGIDRYYSVNYTANREEFGKAAGIGDVELLLAPAPIEIGNLVWDDANSNGIQDAGEAGISGVVVELQDAGGTQITTATTDANGNYIFSNDPNGTSTASHIYSVALSANTAYKLVVPTTNGGNNLTTANTGEGSNTDINDSDANTTTGVADVQATDIPIIGANNHSFDFAYAPVPVGCAMAVTSVTPTACNAGTNTYDLAVVVTYSTPPAGNITVTTDNGGNMSVAQTSSPQTITLTGLTSDGVAAIDVTAVFDGDAACTNTSVDAYDAPASCTVGCPPTVCGTVTVVKN